MSLWARRPGWSRSPARVDLALALALCVASVAEIVVAGGNAAVIATAMLWSLPLALRRRAPLFPALAAAAAVPVGDALDPLDDVGVSFAWLACAAVAAYSVAAYGGRGRAVAGGVALLVALVAHVWPGGAAVATTAVGALLLLVAVASGRLVLGYREGAVQLRALSARLEREREVAVPLAVAQERARMARELHDAIAHAVAGMVVQGAAAERVAGDPGRCRRALAAVQATGRDAIAELRRMLRILRTDDGADRAAVADPALPSPPPRRLPASWSPRIDIVLAVGCLVVAEVSVLAEPGYGPGDRLVSALLVLAATLPVALRRRFPLASMLTIVAAIGVQQAITEWEPTAAYELDYQVPLALSIAPTVAVFSLAELTSLRRTLIGLVVALLVAVTADALVNDRFARPDMIATWSMVLVCIALPGRLVGLHRRQAERLRTVIARLEREGRARERLAVVEERTRLARDLHDAIAHGVSVMVLQAGAAERVLTGSPDRAREAARAVQDTGRTVLAELQRLLGVLGRDDEAAASSPAPTLAGLEALVADVRHAGLPVELRVDGARGDLPAGMEASAYRVIQEGLTNALKHAGAVPTTVTLRYGADDLTVEIVNVGRDGRAPAALAQGHGLVGMRERVELYGGDLDAGPRAAGGFVVRARLPLRDAVA